VWWLLLVALAACSQATAPPATLPEDVEAARVVNVVDGDTVDVRVGGREERVRLIGIDTPETVHPRQPVMCYGREASQRAEALLQGQTVFLEADPSQDSRDRFGRLLRFVWLEDGRMVNQVLVAEGYAFEYTYDLPYRYQREFRAAERAAREAGLGLWSEATCAGQSIPADSE
jgi:micrococcal nuclease